MDYWSDHLDCVPGPEHPDRSEKEPQSCIMGCAERVFLMDHADCQRGFAGETVVINETDNQKPEAVTAASGFIMQPAGIEPTLQESESCVLSVRLRLPFAIGIITQKNQQRKN